MSSTPGRSKLAQIARLAREARVAEEAGRATDALSLLKELVRLDPRDHRALHRLGDVNRSLGRVREAAACYAREARVYQEEGFASRALALWRVVLRHDPDLLEAHERIGALYLELGRAADATLHYDRSARELAARGLKAEAAILLAHLAAAATPVTQSPDPGPVEAGPRRGGPPEESVETAAPPPPDADAVDFAADRLRNGRLFHHYGLHAQARQQLEELVASQPESIEARQLLVEVCRAVSDTEAAAEHLRAATTLMRRQARADAPSEALHWELPPVEEWVGEETPEDPMAAVLEEIREDVERLVDRLHRKGGDR